MRELKEIEGFLTENRGKNEVPPPLNMFMPSRKRIPTSLEESLFLLPKPRKGSLRFLAEFVYIKNWLKICYIKSIY